MAKNLTKKISSNAKKVIILCSMVTLLVVTGVLNFVLNDKFGKPDSNVNGGGVTQETFFSSFRSDIQTTRAEEISILDSIIASADVTKETKAAAEQKKLQLVTRMGDEIVVANLIKAKGYNDVVVKMSDDNVDIVVNFDTELEKVQLSQIFDIVTKETDYPTSQIFVMNHKL
ncbi:MAG: SpoIIIAH-like family protein [Clostridia bacterium]